MVLSAALRKELRIRLTDDEVRLKREVGQLRVATKATTYLEDETDAYDQHIADGASSLVGRQTDMTLLQNLERELAATQTALRRMDEGVYGTCEVCAEPISEARLNARPAAGTCIDCQSALEARRRRELSIEA